MLEPVQIFARSASDLMQFCALDMFCYAAGNRKLPEDRVLLYWDLGLHDFSLVCERRCDDWVVGPVG